MYCPKCGAQNHDLAYCRECGENLQVISQAKKKHSPVAFVSKLDAVIEKKNERFRRDAILGALMGTSFLILSVFEPLGGSFYTILNLFMFLLGIFSLSMSGWYFLAYGRSLERRKKPLDISLKDESLLLGISQIGTSPSDIGAATNKLGTVNDSQIASSYCPRCGAQNLENVSYCCTCGTSLNFSVHPQGLERYLPAFLVKKLDAVITKNENAGYKSQHRSGWTLFIFAFISLFNVIIQGLEGNWGLAAFYLVSGISTGIIGSWNLVAYRRNLEKENKSLDETSITFSSEVWMFLSINWKEVVAIFVFTLIVAGLAYFGIAAEVTSRLFLIIIFFASIISVASFLKFQQNLRSQNGKQFLDNAASPTKEHEIQDTHNTLSLSSPPLSVTEATTKPLDSVVKHDEREKISFAQIPDKPRV